MNIDIGTLPEPFKEALRLVDKRDRAALLAILISYSSELLPKIKLHFEGKRTPKKAQCVTVPLTLIDIEGKSGKDFTDLAKELLPALSQTSNVNILQPNVPILYHSFVAKLEKLASHRLGLHEIKMAYAYKATIESCQQQFCLAVEKIRHFEPITVCIVDKPFNNVEMCIALVFAMFRFDRNESREIICSAIDSYNANLLFTEPLNNLTIE